MAIHVFQLKFLILVVMAFQLSLVHSEPEVPGNAIPENQLPLAGAIERGDSEICKVKQELVYNLDQRSFYLKADCQNQSYNALDTGCVCTPPTPRPKIPCISDRCCPKIACCPPNALLAKLKKYNEYYANHSKELFGCHQT
jgi:hypothetical protein